MTSKTSATIAVGATLAAGTMLVRQFSSNSLSSPAKANPRPSSSSKNVGILGMEIYTPSTFIRQSSLEEHAGVSPGKYTLGLGQEGMGLVCGDCEDVNSLALTVVHSLLEKYAISPDEVGRVEIGTETLVDKSKSTKTLLMDLFAPNTDIEGATILNACYGGTAALLNAFNWVESDGWDGRFAIVVAADIAAYKRGPARPTSGAGAVAMLIGRDAPLRFDPREKVTHASNEWDFFKPDPSVEYPTVDGGLSQVCYYRALEDCYGRFADKIGGWEGVDSADYWVFHAPYNKLVQKSFGRLFLVDARRRSLNSTEEEEKKDKDVLNDYIKKPKEDTYSDKTLEKVLKQMSSDSYEKRLFDSNYVSKHVGNTYTASVFLGLASLIERAGTDLTPGKSIAVFSYGSGAIASMYRLTVQEASTCNPRFTIAKMMNALRITERLSMREEVHPCELDHALETRARMHRAGAPYSPVYPPSRLFPGTYYLNGIDSQWRRTYSRIPIDATPTKGGSLVPPIVLRLAKREEVSTPVTGKMAVLESFDHVLEGRKRVACVITGIAAGLPGGDGIVFRPDNLDRLIRGDQCITSVSGSDKMALLEKNVVQLLKKNGSTKRHPVMTESDTINLAAQIGPIHLTASYGVPPGLAETMDKAAQVAVASGMEALKSAGLVSGATPSPQHWKLPEQYRDTTGVVYASSFPAMDAAVGEVMRFLQSKTVGASNSLRLVEALRSRFLRASEDRLISDDDEAAFARLASRARELEEEHPKYEFDRKFLFRVLVLGNAQLAQLAGCRGPNTQTNAACAGTTQAIAMAQDMLVSGRAERVVVVAGDNASGSTLLPWLGSGFRALGAACISKEVEEAALPFDKRRNGMLLGAGGIGMVLETEKSVVERNAEIKARLLATQYSNSAFHGAALDRNHIASELNRFLTEVELVHGIGRAEICQHGVYFSHETCTHASDASSCAGNEIAALRTALGDSLLSKLLICNTKGFTGHPMGVSFEDVTAVEVLMRQEVPPIVNFREKDDYLGDLNLSRGGKYSCRYALRFAAGFGSQVAFALYATAQEF